MAQNYMDYDKGLLGGGEAAGFFDPSGSQAFRTNARRRLLQQGRSRRNRSALLSRLGGLNSIQQRQALIDTDQDVAGQTAGALNDFDVSEYGNNRDFFRGLLRDRIGYDREAYQREKDRKAQERAAWGQLGGAVIGALPFGR